VQCANRQIPGEQTKTPGSIARKLLERCEGTPLEMDMRSVLAKIAESLQGTVSRDIESLTDQTGLTAEE
jgi:hypothetical protein